MLALEAYTPRQLEPRTGGPSNRDMLVTLDDLHDEFRGLDFLVGEEIEPTVNEGSLHTGLSAVVRVLARKSWRRAARVGQPPSGSGVEQEPAQ